MDRSIAGLKVNSYLNSPAAPIELIDAGVVTAGVVTAGVVTAGVVLALDGSQRVTCVMEGIT